MELRKVLEARLKQLQEACSKQQARVLSLEKTLTGEKTNLDVLVGQLQECELYFREFGGKPQPIEENKEEPKNDVE